MELIRRAKNAYIAVSVLMLVIGGCLIIWPEMSLSVFCVVTGIAMIIFGIVKLLGYFSKDLYRLAFQFDLALGIISVLFGIVIVIHPRNLITFVPVIMGIFVMLDGVFKIQTALDARQFGLKAWWVVLVLAICSRNLITFVPVIMGIFVMLDGVFKIQTALDARQFGLKAWWVVLVLAICSGGFGLLLIVNPFEGAVALMMLLGVTMVVDGIQNLLVVLYTVQTTREEMKNDYD